MVMQQVTGRTDWICSHSVGSDAEEEELDETPLERVSLALAPRTGRWRRHENSSGNTEDRELGIKCDPEWHSMAHYESLNMNVTFWTKRKGIGGFVSSVPNEGLSWFSAKLDGGCDADVRSG